MQDVETGTRLLNCGLKPSGMLDLDAFEIEVPCPECGFYTRVLLKQVRVRDVVVCRGCKANIQLEDHMNEYRKGRKQVRRTFQDLESTIEDLSGDLTIEL
jgi:predicted RNA-binding Zn-ribbon protein involved in translation (DUF1610 family)